MFLEYPKAIHSPNGEEIVVEDADEEAAKRAEWGQGIGQDLPADSEPVVIRRGPGRPRKVA
jgi:hypothetical protein